MKEGVAQAEMLPVNSEFRTMGRCGRDPEGTFQFYWVPHPAKFGFITWYHGDHGATGRDVEDGLRHVLGTQCMLYSKKVFLVGKCDQWWGGGSWLTSIGVRMSSDIVPEIGFGRV